MKIALSLILAPVVAVLVCGCSPDALTAAGTQAGAAAQAAKQAQQEKQMADQRIQAMQEAMQQHDRNLSEQADRAPERGSQ